MLVIASDAHKPCTTDQSLTKQQIGSFRSVLYVYIEAAILMPIQNLVTSINDITAPINSACAHVKWFRLKLVLGWALF